MFGLQAVRSPQCPLRANAEDLSAPLVAGQCRSKMQGFSDDQLRAWLANYASSGKWQQHR